MILREAGRLSQGATIKLSGPTLSDDLIWQVMEPPQDCGDFVHLTMETTMDGFEAGVRLLKCDLVELVLA